MYVYTRYKYRHIRRIVNERQKNLNVEHACPLSLSLSLSVSLSLSLPNLIHENKLAITTATHLDILNVVKPESKLLFANCKKQKTKKESSRSSSLLDPNQNPLVRPKARAKCNILLTPATKMLEALHARMLCKSSSHENALQKQKCLPRPSKIGTLNLPHHHRIMFFLFLWRKYDNFRQVNQSLT